MANATLDYIINTIASDISYHPKLQTITVNQWNSIIQAVGLLRDGIVAGEYHGLVENDIGISSALTARIRYLGNRVQISQHGDIYRTALHPEVNLKDFFSAYGGDNLGITDCSAAFNAAIAYFGVINQSYAGTIIVEVGKYRMSGSCRLKKCVHIKGQSSGTQTLSVWIYPDPGVDSFVFERYNTPLGTSDSGYGDGSTISGLTIQPSASCVAWGQSQTIAVGARRRTGTGAGEDWRHYYICITAGVTSSSGSGPTGFTASEVDGSVIWSYVGGGHGIKVRANGVTVRDVVVLYANGNGFHIEAPDPEALGADCNANSWHFNNVQAWSCEGHGLYTNGGDSNGGTLHHGVFYGNGGATSDEDYTGVGYNIYESSFLGNAYFGLQFGFGGIGSIYSDSVGGNTLFSGCYQEGTGGGYNIASSTTTVIGGNLSNIAFSPSSNPVIVSSGSRSTGGGWLLTGYSASPWRTLVNIPVGVKRSRLGNVYVCVTAGVTGATGPSGTGANIVDGTVHWDFVSAETTDGSLSLGSNSPSQSNFLTLKMPDPNDSIDYNFLKYGNFVGVTNALGWFYSQSSIGGQAGSGLMLAQPQTVLTEWPMKVPTGRALFEVFWIGGCQVAYSATAADPTVGTWNPGDKICYKGAASGPGSKGGRKCVTYGTAGSYTGGRTATATGTTTVTISGAAMNGYIDAHDFKVGDKLTINGITSRVQSSSIDGRTLVMGSSITSGSGLAIAFSPPVFEEFA